MDVNEFGPLQLYVAPNMLLAIKFNICPAHIGPLLPAVGAAGVPFTVTDTVPTGPVHPPMVANTE